MTAAAPQLSVVVAARNASGTLGACLAAACAQADEAVEIIVVDDCSTDPTTTVASQFPVRLIAFDTHRGVAAARNAGARAARAPLLIFMDADVVPAGDLFARGLAAMAESGADAMIGSYDGQPIASSTVSLFKNLAHHHFHQRARREATTFWGACGFIRRDLFLELGGFDETRFVLPSIEDIELGWRLVQRGNRIHLDRGLQVTHLKRWTLASLLYTDVVRRAIPWTRLALEAKSLPNDLNLSWPQRLAALGAVALGALFLCTLRWRKMWVPVAALLPFAIALNWPLYRLFYRRGGLRLAVSGFALQQLYYLYSLCGLGAGLLLYCADQTRGRERCPRREERSKVAGRRRRPARRSIFSAQQWPWRARGK